MYLSKIEMLGFKSFAHHVDVKFDSGITAIVGPNGCGKTNIVDAIRWVLGEQRYGALRSDKMEDLIFNGTKNRKPLGMCEVSLVIENTKGILPTEYSEVTITRRIYRSGESEYLLNKTTCRLRDILDLFMDTGIGPDAYSVIELKMVETILSDKADERRKLFEEAAGVTKYKHRRKSAYRKLENVQQDLTRVNDIVKEVQKAVNSLERQAKKAEQYNEISDRLKTIEIDLLEREYAHLHSRRADVREKLALASGDKETVDHDLAAFENEIESLRSALVETEQELATVQQEVSSLVARIHRIEERSLIATERRGALQANIERWENERIELRAQHERLQSKRLELVEKLAQSKSTVSAIEQEYIRCKEDLTALDGILTSKKVELQRENDDAISLLLKVGEKKSAQEKARGRTENMRGRIERAREDNERYSAELRLAEDRVHHLTAEDRELRRRFVESEMHLFQQESTKKQYLEEAEALQHKAIALKTELERKLAKLDFLRGLLEGEEGVNDGAKYLLSQDAWKKERIVSVADIVTAPEKFRVAIEAALGEAAQYLVVRTNEDAFAAARELRAKEKGKVTFVAIDRLPSWRHDRSKIRNQFRWANEVAHSESQYRPLVDILLDGYVIVDSVEDAKRVHSNLAGVRCVTLEGEIIGSAGLIRGGSLRQDEGGSLGKRDQIAELERDLTRLRQEIENVRGERESKIREAETLDLRPYRDGVKSIEKEMTAVEMRIAQLEFEKKRANEASQRNIDEITAATMDIVELQAEFDALKAELVSLEQQKIEREKQIVSLSHEVERFEDEWNERSRQVNDLEVRLATLQGEYRNLERESEYTEAGLRDGVGAITRREQDIADARKELMRLSVELEEAEKELEILRADRRSVEARKQSIEETYTDRRNHIHKLELKIKDNRRLHDDSVAAVHEIEMKSSELTSNIEHVKERARSEFDLDLQIKTYPEDEFVDFASRREEVRQLKEKIRAMGAINFAAFDEFTSESERLNFLTQQREDLLEAERILLATIEEINATAQKKFLDTFALIRENFIRTFQGLFDPGDECDLRLEEDVDALEAAIEIIAKPRGKRPTSIDLLSGGEKTLTAIALLFAIYLVKPSPFCILDEVDAPLDDSNIDRYTRILRSFSDNTQFIVVTHNKRTMEAANALYGVTMEEEGVSKLVTVRFTEEARVRSASIASGG